MTSEQLYLEFKILLNKNGRFTNVDYPKSNFVVLFNREQERWYSQTISKKKDSDDITDIQNLLVKKELEFSGASSNYNSYDLPSDWFQYALFQAYATNGCTKLINARRVNKIKNLNEILTNEYSSPSFEWEETIYVINDNKVDVYFSDFSISSVIMYYYKKLTPIDLEGYITIEDKSSKTINSDLDDIYLRQILDRVVLEVQREVENQAGHQYSKERVNTQEREVF
jgi:hypothetical protein